MRLICPNCDAQYEVPSNVIPAGGRDVQCSSCAHTWFQAHPDDELAPENTPAPEEDWATEPDPVDEQPEIATALPEPEPEPERKPRSLDPSVIEVLREEADRETRQRAVETSALEMQPELGLSAPEDDEAARQARESREHMARVKGDIPPSPDEARIAAETAVTTASASSRRELLPDIEEINETLRASPTRRGMSRDRDMTTPQGHAEIEDGDIAQRSGFSTGFRTAIAITVLAVALYIIAPSLIGMVPALGSALVPYVEAIDAARLWLDGQIVALLQMLDGFSSEASAQ